MVCDRFEFVREKIFFKKKSDFECLVNSYMGLSGQENCAGHRNIMTVKGSTELGSNTEGRRPHVRRHCLERWGTTNPCEADQAHHAKKETLLSLIIEVFPCNNIPLNNSGRSPFQLSTKTMEGERDDSPGRVDKTAGGAAAQLGPNADSYRYLECIDVTLSWHLG
jgi:hypothetical protein